MRFGFGRLRLPSEAFWAMTPAELGAAASAHAPQQAPALDRDALTALLDRYPDQKDA